MTDTKALIERLREHATDWDGKQMPDAEPAKGDPTAGTLREAADRIAALEAEVARLKALGDGLARALRRRTANPSLVPELAAWENKDD